MDYSQIGEKIFARDTSSTILSLGKSETSLIDNMSFDCGHIVSEKDGGTQEITNLRPICSACNNSMGTQNMIEYIKTYGFYI